MAIYFQNADDVQEKLVYAHLHTDCLRMKNAWLNWQNCCWAAREVQMCKQKLNEHDAPCLAKKILQDDQNNLQ